MPTQCQVAGLEDALSRVIVFLVSTEEITMSNSEDVAYQQMLRGCEYGLVVQQVGDDETELEDRE